MFCGRNLALLLFKKPSSALLRMPTFPVIQQGAKILSLVLKIHLFGCSLITPVAPSAHVLPPPPWPSPDPPYQAQVTPAPRAAGQMPLKSAQTRCTVLPLPRKTANFAKIGISPRTACFLKIHCVCYLFTLRIFSFLQISPQGLPTIQVMELRLALNTFFVLYVRRFLAILWINLNCRLLGWDPKFSKSLTKF